MRTTSFIALILLLTSGAAYAQPERIRFETPQPDVYDGQPMFFYGAHQDAIGFLWFASEDGLLRYDGYEFVSIPVDPADPHALPTRRTLGIAEDNQGRLWIGLDRFGLCRYDPITGRFERFPLAIQAAPYNLNVDSQGLLWFYTEHDRTLSQFNPETRELEQFERLNGIEIEPVQSLTSDHSGNLWLIEGDEFGRIWKKPMGENWERVEERTSGLSLLVTRDGSIRLVDSEGTLRRYDPVSNLFVAEPGISAGLLQGTTSVWHVDGNGLLWFARQNDFTVTVVDLASGQMSRLVPNPQDPFAPPPARVQHILEDRTGVIWIAGGMGLRKVRPFRSAFENIQLPNSDFGIALARSQHHDAIVSSMCGHLYSFDTGELSPVGGPQPSCVSGVLEAHDGSVWLAGWDRQSGGGLVRQHPSGSVTTFDTDASNPDALSDRSIRVLFEDFGNTLWVGTESGLDRYNPTTNGFEHFRHDLGNPETLGSSTVWSLYEDREDRFWVGTYGGGLALLDRETGRATRYVYDIDDPTSISANIVTAIHEREDEEDVLWIATLEGGLNRFDTNTAQFERIGRREGFPSQNIKSLLEDDAGMFWMGTDVGLVRFNPETRTSTLFTSADGLPEDNFGLFDAAHLPDGWFLFGMQRNLVRFHPADIAARPFEAPVVLTSLRSAGELLRLGPNPEQVQIPWSNRTVEFEFAALHYPAPEHTRYRYQLSGLSDEWIDLGDRRFTSFTNLAPGDYTFRVQALSNSGVPSDEDLAISLKIVPPFWKTFWFRAIVILCMIVGLILLVRQIATRRLKERLRSQSEALRLQNERERISRDLHDHVGAQLSNMLVGLELARLADQSSGDGEPTATSADPLKEVEEDARTTMRQLRETIWALHQESVSLEAFAEQIRRDLSNRLKYQPGLSSRLEVAEACASTRLSSMQALHLFRVAQEAITNTIKYAEAATISISLSCENEDIRMVIQDDGQFLVQEESSGGSTSGFGLTNMRARVDELDGTFHLDTTAGTTITVSIPSKSEHHIPVDGD